MHKLLQPISCSDVKVLPLLSVVGHYWAEGHIKSPVATNQLVAPRVHLPLEAGGSSQP